MEALTSGAVWGALGAIIVANILLSGDNAVVIAMAARSLPPKQQTKAIVYGSAAAIVMRIVLTIVAVQMLQVPYLKIVGGLALLWIGAQLLLDTEEEGEVKETGTMGAAIRTILIADLVMSIDNVIAVAAAASRAPEAYRIILLVIGLATSIPLIIIGSALLGWLAGEMFVTDPAIADWFQANVPHAHLVFGIGGAVLVVVVGKWLHHRAARAAADAPMHNSSS
jgi:YjbE family integral membrane protein